MPNSSGLNVYKRSRNDYGCNRTVCEGPLGKREDTKAERISEAEYAVMEVLWDKSPLTAAEVCAVVCEARGWSLATVKTLLGRLVGKGAIKTQPDGRRYLYMPMIARVEYVDGESRRLVDRLFGGRASSLFALSDNDISEIEALLKEIKQ